MPSKSPEDDDKEPKPAARAELRLVHARSAPVSSAPAGQVPVQRSERPSALEQRDFDLTADEKSRLAKLYREGLREEAKQELYRRDTTKPPRGDDAAAETREAGAPPDRHTDADAETASTAASTEEARHAGGRVAARVADTRRLSIAVVVLSAVIGMLVLALLWGTVVESAPAPSSDGADPLVENPSVRREPTAPARGAAESAVLAHPPLGPTNARPGVATAVGARPASSGAPGTAQGTKLGSESSAPAKAGEGNVGPKRAEAATPKLPSTRPGADNEGSEAPAALKGDDAVMFAPALGRDRPER